MKMRIRQTLAALVVSAFTYSGAALAAESLIFPDVIKANGTGDINLLGRTAARSPSGGIPCVQAGTKDK